jgi:aquaporin Z
MVSNTINLFSLNIYMNKYLVEFLGTMLLMYSVVATGNWLAIGGALAIACLFGGPISGAAFNPAVACGMYASGSLAKEDLVPYMIVEVLGALAAVYLYKNMVNKANPNSN